MSGNEYVKPPRREETEYVKPLRREETEYVKPPRREETEYVKPPRREETEYVKPPKHEKNDYIKRQYSSESVKSFEKVVYVSKKSNVGLNDSGGKSDYTMDSNSTILGNDPYTNPSYFSTPKVSFNFYLTGYFILSIIPIWLSYAEFPLKLVVTIYLLLSNYTYSWFSDYQRYKGGLFAWFFTPYGSIKAGWASSLFANYQTGTMKPKYFGGYKIKSRTDYGSHFLHFIIVMLILEILKYYISVFIAFYSLFVHKLTIKKYNALVDERMSSVK